MRRTSNISAGDVKMIGQKLALAPLPRATLESWHRFVASGDAEILRPLLSEDILFRSPIVQSPIPGGGSDFAGADDSRADFREFYLSPHVCRR
jgi:hypothetical protein